MLRAALVLLMIGGTAALAQQAPPHDPALEARFRADVAALSEDAARAFDEGNAARKAQRGDDAIAAYRKAIELAPKIDHPHRRLCGVLAAVGEAEAAVTECELALSLGPSSPYNKSSLAAALLARGGASDLNRSIDLAREAASAVPTDVALTEVWCGAALKAGNQFALTKCSERLLALDPEGQAANYFGAIAAAGNQDLDEAHRLLRKAKTAGLNETTFELMVAELDKLEQDAEWFPFTSDEALTVGGLTFGGWLLVLILLLVIGSSLSNATLRSVDQAATEASGSARERRLRRAYRLVLALAGVFFYLSLPLMAVGVIAFGLGILLVFDEMGGIPIYLLWVTGAMVVVTLVAIVRSLFIRKQDAVSGKRLDLAQHPKLRAMLDEVAARVGTRAVDVVYLVPGAEIAVTERGGLWRAFRGKRSERVLMLGVAQFDGMTQLQLRAILAHEHGHFRNEDTAGGGFALAVRRSLHSLAERLSESGGGGIFNPVWWFVRVFYQLYLGISQGASRLQEVLADRWAIRAYGSAAFSSGYRHVVARSVELDDHLEKTIKEVVENKWSLPNLYDHDPYDKKSEADLAADVAKAMAAEPTVHDSHPSPRQRIEWAERLAVPREPAPDDDAKVWELFDDPDAIERALTAIVRDNLFTQLGVLIPDHDAEVDDTPVTST